jgi:hypothetical protein
MTVPSVAMNSSATLSLFPSIPPPASAFVNPVVYSTKGAFFGLNAPVLAHRPLLTQPAMGQNSGLLIDTRHIEADEGFARAMQLLPKQPEEAGRLFTKVRDERRNSARKKVSGPDPLFVEATFGSALWGNVTGQTFGDLRTIRKKAKCVGDIHTRAREMLIRAVAHSRSDDDESAIRVLKRLLAHPEKSRDDGIRVSALVMYANLLINRSMRYAGDVRSEALCGLYKMMSEDLHAVIKRMQARGEGHAISGSLAKLYLFTAEFLLEQRRPLDAKEIITEARALFPGDEGIESVFRTDEQPEDDPKIRKISPLRQLFRRHHVDIMEHLAAGATEFLRSAQYDNNKQYWARAVGGALFGASTMTGLCVMFGEEPTLAGTMMATSLAATAFAAVGKIFRGAKAPETKQAFLTGYSDSFFTQEAMWEALKIVGTYAFFGGMLPLDGLLPTAIQATADGQIHGMGSLISHVAVNAGVRMQELISDISAFGLVDGASTFWGHWAQTSYFAESLNNGFALPFNDPVEKIFSGTDWHRIPEWARTFSFDSIGNAARSVMLGGVYGWMGLSGSYALASMNPTAARWLDRNSPDYARWVAFPGAFLATSAAMVASGVDPLAAPVLVAFNYAIQHRHWVQNGGSWNILEKGELAKLPVTKYMTAGAVQLLYIGPGNAIKPHIPSLAESASLGQYIWNNIEGHCGMVGFLAALGVVHAWMTGMSVRQTVKAKYAKAWTYEIPANGLKLMLGWTSLAGNMVAQFIKELGFGAVVTNSFREAGGSPFQRDMVMGLIAKQNAITRAPMSHRLGIGISADLIELRGEMIANAHRIHDDGVDAALRGEAYELLDTVLTSRPIADQLLVLTDAYFMDDDARVLLGPNMQKKWYTEIVYRGLTDPTTTPERITEFFNRLRIIAGDATPGLRHVRYNLIIATMRAMAGKYHGEQIEAFFSSPEGAALVKSYGLEKMLEEVKEIARGEGKQAWRSYLQSLFRGKVRKWLDKHTLARDVEPEDEFDVHPVDKFYNAAAVAGRRFKFSAPFSGHSVVENGATISSFLLSASQGDPAFQTTADHTFYAGTIFGILMTPAQERGMTTKKYVSDVIQPLLHIISENACKVGDSRKDVRHNLLVAVWLASQGPHGEIIRSWIVEQKHVFQANGIYGMLKADSEGDRLPRNLNQRRLIKRWFGENLWDSDTSADGRILYPSPHVEKVD